MWKKLKKPILCLAPMAGITDSAFRQLCKYYGAEVVYTEMTSVDGLYYNSKKTLAMLKFAKSEKPIVLQLFGKKPEHFAKAARVAEQAGFDGIDINFGCPARKVVAHGGGVTLMRDLEKCREIIATTIKATKLPVSVKIRVGIGPIGRRRRIGQIGRIGDRGVTALDFVKVIKELPVAAIMVHGRRYEQGFDGPVDYKMIKKVKEQFKGVVIANGGINTPEEAAEMLKRTGADGVGLARGVLGKPWLFAQVKDYLKTEKYKERDPLVSPSRSNSRALLGTSFEQIKKVALRHARLAYRAKGSHGIMELRKHLAWYVKGVPGASRLRAKLVRAKSLKEIERILLKRSGDVYRSYKSDRADR